MSLVIRRIHMYLALFLTPWVVMYALSTAAMNHRSWFRSEGTAAAAFTVESKQEYANTFPAGATPAVQAQQILRDLRLEGTHTVSSPAAGNRLTIMRQDPLVPRRIIYDAAQQQVVVEKQDFEMPTFLERMHRRRGYQHPYALEDAWAGSVDLVIVALVFWSLSGLWLWWEMKKTRLWGLLAAGSGVALFALFLATI